MSTMRISNLSGWSTALAFCLLLTACGGGGTTEVAGLPDEVDYNVHIKPILSDRCYQCHGPDDNARKAELRLDTEEGALAALKEGRGAAIVPGKPHRSELIRRVTETDPDEVMPPPDSKLSLSPYEVALLRRWVEQGAEWKPHWAFLAPEQPTPPEVRDAAWPRNPIDPFVLARLEREGLAPAPEADPEHLLRRVTFDLTGLPPTLEEIDAFLADTSAIAYERVVDRLLASPHYGERMAVEWLDVARYADTHGYQADRARRVWPWRDWVIQAFNDNMPFDQFITWQLAGDLLPNPTREQRLATAFNRHHMQTEEGGSVEEEFRVEYVADRVHTVGTAFLGLTMECARCHDHKFDPFSQKEYYQLFAFFNNVDESGQTSHFTDAVPVPTLLLSDAAFDSTHAALRTRIQAKERAADSLFTQDDPAYQAWLRRAAHTSPPPSRPRGPAAHFPLDGMPGERLLNTVVGRQAGVAEGKVDFVPGVQGQAAKLNGDDALFFPGVGIFSRADPFSLSLWVKAAEALERGVIVHRTRATLDAGSRGYEVGIEDGKLVAALTHMWPHNMLKIAAREPLPLDQWVHVALTYDGSSRAGGLHLYVDGAAVAVAVVRDNLFKDIQYERVDVDLTVGARFRGHGFKNGAVDELTVFDRALTVLEVAALNGKQPLADLLALPTSSRTRLQQETLFLYYLAHHSPAYRTHQQELRRLRQEENERITPVPEIMVMNELPEPRPTFRLERGRYDAPAEQVAPDTPASLLAFPEDQPRNRLGLARWLTAPEHPLTARVTVNRYWQLFFGTGLVPTPEDFGSQGSLPSHPLLLDGLATAFIDGGWDVQALHKQIVLSATYRQSSVAAPSLLARDPENMLLARGPRQRLPAEMIRDNALAASGLLVRTIGGPSVRPYQPAGLWEQKSGARYVQGTGDDLYRRSMYTFWKRTSPPPSMITFDAAARNICTARRQKTSTPMQALILLNDPQYVEAARMLAERMIREGGDTLDDRIAYAYRVLIGRRPRPEEQAVLRETYEEQYRMFSEDRDAARALTTVGAYPGDPTIDPVERAAAAQVAHALMNFDAAITKR